MSDETNPELAANELGCPAWCTARHDLQRHEMDRWHESDTAIVPVIELVSRMDVEPWQLDVVGLDIEVGLQQRVESVDVYLHFGVGDERVRSFRLTVESARRLQESIHHAVTRSDRASDTSTLRSSEGQEGN